MNSTASFLALILLFIMVPVYGHAVQVIDLDQTPPSIFYHSPVGPIVEGKPFEVMSEVKDQSGIARVILYFRSEGDSRYSPLEMINTDRDNYAALIPGNQVKVERIDYFIVAEDRFGNRTMKGSSSAPLSIDVVVNGFNPAGRPGKNRNQTGFQIYFGPGIGLISFSDQGSQESVFLPGIELDLQAPYRLNRFIDFKMRILQSESIELNSVLFQGASGTLYESFQALLLQAGGSWKIERSLFSAGLSAMFDRIYDRNLLSSSGQRLTRFQDVSASIPGAYFGYSRNIPVTTQFKFSYGVEIDLIQSGLSHIYLPIEVVYGF